MGKDKEMSKEDLAEENEMLVGEAERLTKGLEELQASLRAVEASYQQSKASFSLARYGQLKDLIKQLTSEQALQKVHSLTQNQVEKKEKAGGMTGLMHRAREFAAHQDGATPKDHHLAPTGAAKSGGGSGKLSGLFKRIKYATGFAEGPPEDIRYLDKEDIRRDNDRKRREVHRLTTRGTRAHSVIQRLKERYEASKKHAPPQRYQELKGMIKDVLSEQF